jgi:hypothetical protein
MVQTMTPWHDALLKKQDMECEPLRLAIQSISKLKMCRSIVKKNLMNSSCNLPPAAIDKIRLQSAAAVGSRPLLLPTAIADCTMRFPSS